MKLKYILKISLAYALAQLIASFLIKFTDMYFSVGIILWGTFMFIMIMASKRIAQIPNKYLSLTLPFLIVLISFVFYFIIAFLAIAIFGAFSRDLQETFSFLAAQIPKIFGSIIISIFLSILPIAISLVIILIKRFSSSYSHYEK